MNFGVRVRAESFHQLRLDQGFEGTVIKSFQVESEFLDWLRANAVPESMAKDFPESPLLVDKNKAVDQYMLRSEHIKMMFDYMVPGSGEVG
ncbi:hypothetical protein ACFVW1_10340 [Streptomyces olivochromogenes]|uniref:hypothetical protein n=1 Tax=Streptomyces TaxID=1883 RepID=UPI003683E8AB